MQPLSKGWAPRRAAVPHCGIIHVALLQVQEMEVGGVSASRGQPLSKGWAPCRAAASHCGIEYMWHFVAQQARFFTGGSGGWPPENRPLGAIAPPLVSVFLHVLNKSLRGSPSAPLFTHLPLFLLHLVSNSRISQKTAGITRVSFSGFTEDASVPFEVSQLIMTLARNKSFGDFFTNS